LRANVENNHVRHEQVVIVSARSRPFLVPDAERLTIDRSRVCRDGITHVTSALRVRRTPDVPAALATLTPQQD